MISAESFIYEILCFNFCFLSNTLWQLSTGVRNPTAINRIKKIIAYELFSIFNVLEIKIDIK